MSNQELEQRIGIWQDGDTIFRRDSNQEPYPRTYVPKKLEDLPRVVELVELLQDGAQMGMWTAQVEEQQNQLIEELRLLVK